MIELRIDASNLSSELNRLKAVMKPEQFEKAMYGIFRETGRHVKAGLKKELPHEYHVKPGNIDSAVGAPKLSMGSLGVGCIIPIRDRRGSIGGRYRAAGGRHGWRAVKGGKYHVKASVVKSGRSVLPYNAGSYGGMPPFRNLSAPKLNGVAYTREGKERFPIRKVVGIAIPQMPMNRSQAEVQEDIRVFMQNRMEHRFQALISGGR